MDISGRCREADIAAAARQTPARNSGILVKILGQGRGRCGIRCGSKTSKINKYGGVSSDYVMPVHRMKSISNLMLVIYRRKCKNPIQSPARGRLETAMFRYKERAKATVPCRVRNARRTPMFFPVHNGHKVIYEFHYHLSLQCSKQRLKQSNSVIINDKYYVY